MGLGHGGLPHGFGWLSNSILVITEVLAEGFIVAR